jgi:phage baseplate assembly protein W
MPYKNIEINDTGAVNTALVKQSQYYKGFSSVDDTTSATKLFDFDLVKQDIINSFRTRRGERVMNPTFGSAIWDLIMEPATPITRQQFMDDIQVICTSDPRVTPIQMDLTEYETGYFLELTLLLKNTDQTSNMRLQFDQSIGLVVQQ